MLQASRTFVDAARSLLRLPVLARLLAALIALSLLLEISARLMIFGPAGLDPRRVGIVSDLDPRTLVHYDSEPAIVYEYKPKLDVIYKLVPFATNSRGMRDKEYTLAKPANCYRVAVLGSSFTLPAGVAIEDAFHSVLERRLNSQFAPTCYEFLNFAVGLHSPSQTLAMLRHRALGFDPDLVLIGVTAMSAPLLLADANSPPPRHILDLVAPKIRSYFVLLMKARLGLQAPVFSTSPPRYPKELARNADVIARLSGISREAGIPIVLVRLELNSRDPSPVERAVQERAEQQGLFYVDTRSAFSGLTASDFWIYQLDPHPNRSAHEVFADVVEDFIRDRGLLGH